MSYSADKAVGMPFGVQCCHTDLFNNWLMTGPTVRSEQFYITGSTVRLVIVLMISLGIVTELFIAVLTQEVLGVPCLSHCCQAFLLGGKIIQCLKFI